MIVGGGPAGAATALFLMRCAPDVAARSVLLERACHPREKVCAGGLIPHVLDCLDELSIKLSVPRVDTGRALVDVPGHRVYREEPRLCTVVRRCEFDRMLIDEVARRGFEVRQGEPVVAVKRSGGELVVETASRTYRSAVVVGADGSGSLVRRSLGLSRAASRATIGRALQSELPLDDIRWDGYEKGRYDFDFRGVSKGLKGYAWVFPCLIGGVPHANIGVYSRYSTKPRLLQELLAEKLAELGSRQTLPGYKAWPIRWYSPRQIIAAPNVLLVGDAAGVDPLMGEGISYCFEYGRWAAGEIASAFTASDFSFQSAGQRFQSSWVGKKLVRLGLAADFFYGRLFRLWFLVAAKWQGAQAVGLKWYNGVDGWDRKSGGQALAAALRAGRGARKSSSVTKVIRG